MQKEVDECRRASAAWAEQTYALRAQHAAWAAFLERHPRLRVQWEVFLESPRVSIVNELPDVPEPSIAAASQPQPPASASAPTTAGTTPPTGPTTTPAAAASTAPAANGAATTNGSR
jgi:hypothetical protein